MYLLAQNKQVITLIYILVRNLGVTNENLGIHGLARAIFKMFAMEHGEKPK